MTARIAQIFRHPIKSIGSEDLDDVTLVAGQAVPFDREWAVLNDRAKVERRADGHVSAWGKKVNFLTGRAGPSLMAVTAVLGPGMHLTLRHPDLPPLVVDPTADADQARLVEWLRPVWPLDAPAPTAVVRAPGQPLSDQPEPVISLIGTASLADLEVRTGRALSRRRFRANLWVEGWAPFHEFDLIGREIRVGSATLKVEERVGRCRAPDANPDTGQRDFDTLQVLEHEYGHTDLGIFCRVTTSGAIAKGAPVVVL